MKHSNNLSGLFMKILGETLASFYHSSLIKIPDCSYFISSIYIYNVLINSKKTFLVAFLLYFLGFPVIQVDL